MASSASNDMARDLSGYDAWDFGADTNSMAFARETIGARSPVGLNLEQSRLGNMRAAGMLVLEQDILTISRISGLIPCRTTLL
jgi:hypothetical protein